MKEGDCIGECPVLLTENDKLIISGSPYCNELSSDECTRLWLGETVRGMHFDGTLLPKKTTIKNSKITINTYSICMNLDITECKEHFFGKQEGTFVIHDKNSLTAIGEFTPYGDNFTIINNNIRCCE